jgi:hypothetical protein
MTIEQKYKELTKGINWIKKNWDNIPDDFKQNIKADKYKNVEDLNEDGHIVVLLVDRRQKPSVEPCYDFDEERLGINRYGQIIWGFDSGCSCPCPWDDSYPECYNVEKTWKQFKLKELEKDFDRDFLEDALKTVKEIQEKME